VRRQLGVLTIVAAAPRAPTPVIAAAFGWLAEQDKPATEAIREQVRAGPAINSGHTGVRVGEPNRWYWVLQTRAARDGVIVPSHGGEVIAGFRGEATTTAWGSDAFPRQLSAPAVAHRLHLSHQVRDPSYAVEPDGPAAHRCRLGTPAAAGFAVVPVATVPPCEEKPPAIPHARSG
jgi:hypothetical protein